MKTTRKQIVLLSASMLLVLVSFFWQPVLLLLNVNYPKILSMLSIIIIIVCSIPYAIVISKLNKKAIILSVMVLFVLAMAIGVTLALI